MDAFERVVAQILIHQGYWTRTEFKVELTREDKAEIGRPTNPRWELDVLGYNPPRNEVLIVECKSFLDSGGVHINDFDSDRKRSKRFKLFIEHKTREVVFRRLAIQLTDLQLCQPRPLINLALAAGKIAKGQERDSKAIRSERLPPVRPKLDARALG
ncbi:MAG TPA: hypothetical protein VE914_14130 [Candidatus Angelobacter sp.]|nr:hypothetical protein [Candidatus Angelobacter sp.]